MEFFYFWLFLFLIILAFAALPSWGYTRERWPYRHGGSYRYYPSLVAGLVAVLIFVLFWWGIIAIAWPWAQTPMLAD